MKNPIFCNPSRSVFGAKALVHVALACCLCMVGCAGPSAPVLMAAPAPDIVPADVAEPMQWGDAKQVVRLKHLYFSDQPDSAALVQAKANGVAAVINLRSPDEDAWDESSAVHTLGLDYYQVPVSRKGPSLNPLTMKKISTLVQRYSDQSVLLHCSSGNRASAWLAVHLAVDHNLTTAQALDVARRTGLDSPEMESRVQLFLSEHPASSTNN